MPLPATAHLLPWYLLLLLHIGTPLAIHLVIHAIPLITECLRHILILVVVPANRVRVVLAHLVASDIVDVLVLLQFV